MTHAAKADDSPSDSKHAALFAVYVGPVTDRERASGPGFVREISWDRAMALALPKVSAEESDLPPDALAARQFVLHKNQRAYHVVFRTSLDCTNEREIVVDGRAFPIDWTPETPEMKRFTACIHEEWGGHIAQLVADHNAAAAGFETRIKSLEDSQIRFRNVAAVVLFLAALVLAFVLVFFWKASPMTETLRDTQAAMDAAQAVMNSAQAVMNAAAAQSTRVTHLELVLAAAFAACGAVFLSLGKK